MELDWVEYTSATGGTGALALTPVSGQPTWASWLGATGVRWVDYVIVEAATGRYEAGVGQVDLAAGTLTRTSPRSTWDGSSAAGAGATPLGFGTSGVRVLCLRPADVDPRFPTVLTAAPGSALGLSPPHVYAIAGGTVSANREYYVAFQWMGGPVATLGCYVSTVSAGTAKWAIYDILASGFPGAMLVNGNAAALDTGTSGVKTGSVNVHLPRQTYWLAMMFSGTPVCRCENVITAGHPGGLVAGTPAAHYYVAGVFANGLPDPASAAAGFTATASSKLTLFLAPGF